MMRGIAFALGLGFATLTVAQEKGTVAVPT